MNRSAAVDTPHGPGRLVLYPAESPRLTLLLGHGAGKGIDSADLLALADQLPGQGITVALFEQPWVAAGRKVAARPAVLDECLVLAHAQLAAATAGPIAVGGRSAGARSAARCAATIGAVAVVCLAFPLHPPKRPEKSRAEELASVGVPLLVVQGERDQLGKPEEFDIRHHVVPIPHADHGFAVLKRSDTTNTRTLEVVCTAVGDWLGEIHT